MAVIGTFTPARDGGWIGAIRTLTIDARVRFVPNDNRDSDSAPAYRLFIGRHRFGEAWEAQGGPEGRRHYLRVRLDDPAFPEPIMAVLFPSEAGGRAKLVWHRRPAASAGEGDHGQAENGAK